MRILHIKRLNQNDYFFLISCHLILKNKNQIGGQLFSHITYSHMIVHRKHLSFGGGNGKRTIFGENVSCPNTR